MAFAPHFLRKARFSLISSMVLGTLLFVPLTNGYDYPDTPCGFISGISDYAKESGDTGDVVVDSGRLDFEHADWTVDYETAYEEVAYEEGLDVDYSELAPQEKADVMQTYA